MRWFRLFQRKNSTCTCPTLPALNSFLSYPLVILDSDGQEGANRDMDEEWAEKAAVVLDPRLADIWASLWKDAETCVPFDNLGGLLRLAYLTGYHDSLSEPERGAMYRTLGLRIPQRRRKVRSATRGSSA